MNPEENPATGQEHGAPPAPGILDWLIFALCLGFPWLWPPHVGTALALLCLFGWFTFVRPTWRGLLPTFLTAALIINVVVRLVHFVSWFSTTWSPF